MSTEQGGSGVDDIERIIISNSTCPASSSMPPRSNVITGASNAQFVNTPLHQQYLTSLPSTPLPGTPQSIAPTTMDLLPQTGGLQPFQLGQDINQITNIPQQNVIQNEQFLLSRHMSMVNAGNSQVPVNQPARNMRNPYGAASNSYYYPTSNLPADYRLDPSPRPQMGIGATSPFIRARMAQMQQNYQQIANNPDFNPFRPQLGHLQALVTQGTGYTGGGPHQQMLLNMAIPQRKMIFQDDSPSPSNPDQLLSWFPQGLGNQRQELSCPSTSIPRYNISLYDPSFVTMGLPVDPHLRMFLASLNRENVAEVGNQTDQDK
ncbi:hypothetical protein AAG906_013652 [Vitis piasezkii]